MWFIRVHTDNVIIAFFHAKEESLTGGQNCDPIWLFIHVSLCKAKKKLPKKSIPKFLQTRKLMVR